MASLHVPYINDWQNTEAPRILINNNYDIDTDSFSKKRKCDTCSCISKENVTQENRKRSKSESQKSINTNKYDFCVRTRTYSGNRSMHDKAMNVRMMPNDMQVLLDKYKNDLEWQNNVNGKSTNGEQHFSNEDALHEKVPNSISHDCNDFKTIFKSKFEPDQRERIVGIKRCREKSPNNLDDDNAFNDGIPIKIYSRSMLDAEGSTDPNNLCCCKRKGPIVPVASKLNGTNNSHVNSEFGLEKYEQNLNFVSNTSLSQNKYIIKTPVEKTDNERLSISESCQESVEEVEEECECYKVTVESMPIKNFENGKNYVHPGLRMSLFPNVPPYVKFSTYDEKGEQFPMHVHKLLRWKLSNITPVVVRKVVTNSGFRLLRKSTYWGGTWGKHTRSPGFRTLYDYQKMNHFPGTFQIGRKDKLWKSLQKLMVKHGKNKFDFMPTTYVLPQDKKILRMAWKKNSKEPWIIKPPASARGTGIKVVHRWNQIPENTPIIVQRYISDPYLINDTKFDLRLYVLVTSVNPLRIYLYDDGLVRFASVKYSTEVNTLSDRYMHLTNYSINKLSSKYKQNEDAHACQGHKWTLKTLWSYMERELHVNVQKLWTRLIDLIIKTIISGEYTVTLLSNSNLGSRYNSYELFGIDVLFDTDLKPWLLEVNISPSLHSSSPLDLAVKAPMVHDLMNIVGFQIPSSKKFTEEQLVKDLGNVPAKRLCYDSRLYTRVLSSAEKYKQHAFSSLTRTEYLKKILDDLTPDDVRHLIQYEDELTQLGSFQKIFPTVETHEYLEYFDGSRYYNMLFDAWETKYHNRREEGIEILRQKCEENIHLRVPKVTINGSKICEIHQKCLLYHSKNPNSAANDYTLCLYKSALQTSQSKVKSSFNVKPRYRSRYSTVMPRKTYLLRSKKY